MDGGLSARWRLLIGGKTSPPTRGCLPAPVVSMSSMCHAIPGAHEVARAASSEVCARAAVTVVGSG